MFFQGFLPAVLLSLWFVLFLFYFANYHPSPFDWDFGFQSFFLFFFNSSLLSLTFFFLQVFSPSSVVILVGLGSFFQVVCHVLFSRFPHSFLLNEGIGISSNILIQMSSFAAFFLVLIKAFFGFSVVFLWCSPVRGFNERRFPPLPVPLTSHD